MHSLAAWPVEIVIRGKRTNLILGTSEMSNFETPPLKKIITERILRFSRRFGRSTGSIIAHDEREASPWRFPKCRGGGL